jgi:hypothetical protein
MEPFSSIIGIATTIQIAVAPVFLLAAIAGFLNVLSARLGRIVDRARVLENQMGQNKYQSVRPRLESESRSLWRRVRLINWAIWLCATSALSVCFVIIAIFIGEYVSLDIALTVGLLFIWAMVLLAVGLLSFLAEISISTQYLRRGLSIALEESESASQEEDA